MGTAEEKNIYILYTNSGGGHINTAKAIKAYIKKIKKPWKVNLINPYVEFCFNIDLFRIFSGKSGDDIYNNIVRKKNPNFYLLMFIILVKANFHLVKSKAAKKMAQFWKESKPDMIISVMPLFNHIISNGIELSSLKIPFLTVITDYDEIFKGQWMSSEKQFLICGTQNLVSRAQKIGYSPERVFYIPGLVVSHAFYETKATSKQESILALGLDPTIPIALVSYGKYGSEKIIKISHAMRNTLYPIQFIFICGNNKTFEKVKKIQHRHKTLVYKMVSDINHLMSISDVFIGKPGGTSLSEALVMKLPLVLEKSYATMPQERCNVKWALQHRVGLSFSKTSQLPKVVEEVIVNSSKFKEAIDRLGERDGLFRLPQLIDSLL